MDSRKKEGNQHAALSHQRKMPYNEVARKPKKEHLELIIHR